MRKFLIPEVVQTSSLDCGPAALKALLEGFGHHVSYARLRGACQTGLDGTAIETLEFIANQLGLEAEQIMLPLDHLLLPPARALPAIVVVTLAQGITHFVVVWRRTGNWLQIMDPSVGRRWVRASAFLNDVYQHTMTAGAQDWLDYVRSEDFQRIFQFRQRRLGVHLEPARADWHAFAALDATLRLAQSLADSGHLSKGADAQKLIGRFARQPDLIPANYWSVTCAGDDAEGSPQVFMRGAVLVRVKTTQAKRTADIVPPLNEDLSAALEEKPASPAYEICRILFKHRGLTWWLLLCSVIAAAACIFLEALLFRGLLDVNATLALAGQRMGATAAVLTFCGALLLLELPAFATGTRLGRVIENSLRAAFLEKLPRLSDHYFQSRPMSDLAERSHILHRLRHLPDQLRQLVLASSQLIITAAGVVWLEPAAWPFMLASLLAALIPFFSSQSILAERDLRVRTHSGGLMRFYLDAMLGLMPIRTHGAAQNLRRQHGLLLKEWTAAGIRLQTAVVFSEGLQLSLMFGLVAALLLLHPFSNAHIGRVLLLAYWALNMPALGQEIATLARQYPGYRSIVLRLLEPLHAPDEQTIVPAHPLLEPPSIEFQSIHVIASGTTILSDVSATIPAGSHVAIVGLSGAGKSTLMGLLLGWLKPSSGRILINGEPHQLEQIRRSAAWVDPAVQIWNTSLQSNLSYGAAGEADLAEVIDAAALRHVLENLPNGLQTPLGENGGLVSGGEGQRVRFARALQRRHAKLVLLDEPFRGLDRTKRRELLARAREYWRESTLLCVTHDLSETVSFDRVLVMEGGVILESGAPSELAANSESRYSQLVTSEEQARANFWESSQWRRIHLHSGRIVEEMPRPLTVEKRESVVA